MVQLDDEAPPVERRAQVEVFDFSAHTQRDDISPTSGACSRRR